MKTKYESYTHINGVYTINQKEDLVPKLPSGIYNTLYDPSSQTIFYKVVDHKHDNIVDLPGTAFDSVVKELTNFLMPKTKKAFEDYGFIYKRSSLLYGPPGTGKTCIVNRVTSEVLKNEGIILFNPNPEIVENALEQIRSLNPDTLVMVIFEELDQLVKMYEGKLLNLLDGEVQKDNVIYLATTNYVDQIPDRIKRPGRFSSIIEVGFPKESARRSFLSNKLKKEDDIEAWVKKTEGLSIDEISECVKSVCCLGYDLDLIIKRIKSLDKSEGIDEDDDYMFMENQNRIDREILRNIKNR